MWVWVCASPTPSSSHPFPSVAPRLHHRNRTKRLSAVAFAQSNKIPSPPLPSLDFPCLEKVACIPPLPNSEFINHHDQNPNRSADTSYRHHVHFGIFHRGRPSVCHNAFAVGITDVRDDQLPRSCALISFRCVCLCVCACARSRMRLCLCMPTYAHMSRQRKCLPEALRAASAPPFKKGYDLLEALKRLRLHLLLGPGDEVNHDGSHVHRQKYLPRFWFVPH